jgi:hypothetical protein
MAYPWMPEYAAMAASRLGAMTKIVAFVDLAAEATERKPSAATTRPSRSVSHGRHLGAIVAKMWGLASNE